MTKRGPFPTPGCRGSYYYPSSLVFRVAVDAVKRCEVTASDPTEWLRSNDPYVAIVFSAASYEALLNDVIHLASEIGGDHWPLLALHGQYLLEQRASVRQKADLISLVLTGSRCNWGVLPYQDWSLLEGLRNAMLHARPEGYVLIGKDGRIDRRVDPDVVKGLRTRGVLAEENVTGWHVLLQTYGVARWAATTAADMVKMVHSLAPEALGPVVAQLANPFIEYLNS